MKSAPALRPASIGSGRRIGLYDEADTHRLEVLAIDEDEAAEIPVDRVWLDCERPIERQNYLADIVAREAVRLVVGPAVRINPVCNAFDGATPCRCCKLQIKARALNERLLAAPEQARR